MADKLTPERRSQNMARIRSKGMKPEMIVRSLAHSMGYRFRLHRKDLPGKPDLVFPRTQKVIFVHGCFWHQHAEPTCLDGRLPKSRENYWAPKLKRNVDRDAAALASLKSLGWEVCTIWECETKDKQALRKRLGLFLD